MKPRPVGLCYTTTFIGDWEHELSQVGQWSKQKGISED